MGAPQAIEADHGAGVVWPSLIEQGRQARPAEGLCEDHGFVHADGTVLQQVVATMMLGFDPSQGRKANTRYY